MTTWLHLGDTRPKARKHYCCVLCEQGIPPGTVHVARRGICEAGPTTVRMHVVCDDLTRKQCWDEEGWEMHDFGEFRIMINAMIP